VSATTASIHLNSRWILFSQFLNFFFFVDQGSNIYIFCLSIFRRDLLSGSGLLPTTTLASSFTDHMYNNNTANAASTPFNSILKHTL
jgi:hypothetical protein